MPVRASVADPYELDEAERNPSGTARLSGHRGRWASRIEGADVMASDQSDQGAKDKIKKGMSESGKDQATGGGQAGKGGGGHGADPDKLTEGMSEAGSGVPTGGEGSDGKSGSTSR